MRVIRKTNPKNNIQQWMETNLSKADFDKLIIEVPNKIGVSPRTWLNYRAGNTDIGISTLTELYKILLPYAIDKENFTITNLINQ